MKIKQIEYLVPPKDIINDSLDVFVLLDDDYCTNEFSYFVEVTTPQFLSILMEEGKSTFVPPGYPYIIVSKLTDDIIHSAIQSFIDEQEDSYWLKLYHLIPKLTTEEINKILYRKKEENIKLETQMKTEIDADE